MCDIFADDARHCQRVGLHQWRKRPLRNKVLESVVRLLSPVL